MTQVQVADITIRLRTVDLPEECPACKVKVTTGQADGMEPFYGLLSGEEYNAELIPSRLDPGVLVPRIGNLSDHWTVMSPDSNRVPVFYACRECGSEIVTGEIKEI